MKNPKPYTYILATIATFFLLLLSSTHAIEYFHIGGRPAYPDSEIENSNAWFIYNLDAGEQKEDALEAVNNYEETLEMLIYAADGLKSSSGGFALRQFVEEKEAVGSWIRFYPDDAPEKFNTLFQEQNESILGFCSIQLEQGDDWTQEDLEEFDKWCEGEETVQIEIATESTRLIRFVFSVPEDAEVGEHTGGIVIQKVEPEKEETVQGISLTTRVGIRVYQTVPGDIIRDLRITDFKVAKMYKELDFFRLFSKNEKPEEFLLTTKLENSGNVSINFSENIVLKNELTDEIILDVKDREFQILRDDQFVSNFSWNNPRFGKFSFMNVISFADQEGNIKSLPSPKITIWIIPYREIILAVGILLVVLFIFSIVKLIRKAKYSGKGWGEYTVQIGETLGDLSERFDVDWKKIARTNNIKPPYVLKAGETILVPKKK